ncbi:MAG: hypothetical protein H7222_15795 [Methylotenera sp.]|nr:hypothetical protein [Oligoflexia bacterium]
MKASTLAFVSLLLLRTFPAQAITLEIYGRTLPAVMKGQNAEIDLRESVGAVTERLLNENQRKGLLKFEGNSGGIVSINGLRNAVEVVTPTLTRAYGWCFSVNGLAPDEMPDQSYFHSQQDVLRWFYGYAEFRNGKWISQCVPAVRTP